MASTLHDSVTTAHSTTGTLGPVQPFGRIGQYDRMPIEDLLQAIDRQTEFSDDAAAAQRAGKALLDYLEATGAGRTTASGRSAATRASSSMRR
jgi:hypothetical protein